MVLLILTNMVVLGTAGCGPAYGWLPHKGVALGILPLLIYRFEPGLLVFALLSIVLKGIVFPRMLGRTCGS
jgi:hypothetical protein